MFNVCNLDNLVTISSAVATNCAKHLFYKNNIYKNIEVQIQ